MEKNVKNKIRIEPRTYCVNHTEIKSTRMCEDCDQPYCNECMTEYWTHNFLSYAYLGEKKDFKKHWLCKNCLRKKQRRGVLTALFILLGVFVIPIIVLIQNYHL